MITAKPRLMQLWRPPLYTIMWIIDHEVSSSKVRITCNECARNNVNWEEGPTAEERRSMAKECSVGVIVVSRDHLYTVLSSYPTGVLINMQANDLTFQRTPLVRCNGKITLQGRLVGSRGKVLGLLNAMMSGTRGIAKK